VKLITLSLSPSFSLSRSGVSGLWSAGTVLPRGRVGVVLSLFRKLRDFAVWLATVVLDASRLVSTPPITRHRRYRALDDSNRSTTMVVHNLG
jgi:hypothetical protein